MLLDASSIDMTHWMKSAANSLLRRINWEYEEGEWND